MQKTEWRVKVGSGSGERDITQNVIKIENIRQGIDTRRMHRFNTGQAQFHVLLASLPIVGNTDVLRVGQPVHISVKHHKDSTLKTVFFGDITTVKHDVKKRVAKVIASDFAQRIHQDEITDFGISKRIEVSPQITQHDAESEYPFRIIAPVSNKSLRNAKSGHTELKLVQRFTTRGQRIDENLTYDENTLRSEGRVLEPPPTVTLKAPYRHKKIQTLIKKLIQHQQWGDNLVDKNIEIDTPDTDDHFSTNGRIGYDIEANSDDNTNAPTTGTAVFWTGTVTDFLIDDGIFYFLYSSRGGRARILSYHPKTDEYHTVYTAKKRPHPEEWWRMVKNGNHFYILGTYRSSIVIDLPVLGAYDPTEINPLTFIKQINVSDTVPKETMWIEAEKPIVYKPVLAMYYQLGFDADGANNNVRQGIQPDTRKGFFLNRQPSGIRLYYLFANRTRCGIAVATEPGKAEDFASFLRDDYFNHLGMDFTIKTHGNQTLLYAGITFQEENRSQRLIFSKSIS